MATLTSEARLIVATNVPLAEAVARGRFRADLFYRLQVLTIALPPLRTRRDEIPALAMALLPRGARLAESARAALQAYEWPGNIRELKNALWRASILADGAPIAPVHLGLVPPDGASAASSSDEPVTLAEAERRTIAAALAATGGNKAQAAERLGIARSTLLEKLKRGG